MTHIKHPLIGDQTYGRNLNFSLNNLPQELKEEIKQTKRQALHARKLEFVHPFTKVQMSFVSSKSFEFMPEMMKIINFSKI
jgi:23S rRNA pseudouridine1911/1915/1917 synthase